jgi:hypothetical protein
MSMRRGVKEAEPRRGGESGSRRSTIGMRKGRGSKLEQGLEVEVEGVEVELSKVFEEGVLDDE